MKVIEFLPPINLYPAGHFGNVLLRQHGFGGFRTHGTASVVLFGNAGNLRL